MTRLEQLPGRAVTHPHQDQEQGQGDQAHQVELEDDVTVGNQAQGQPGDEVIRRGVIFHLGQPDVDRLVNFQGIGDHAGVALNIDFQCRGRDLPAHVLVEIVTLRHSRTVGDQPGVFKMPGLIVMHPGGYAENEGQTHNQAQDQEDPDLVLLTDIQYALPKRHSFFLTFTV